MLNEAKSYITITVRCTDTAKWRLDIYVLTVAQLFENDSVHRKLMNVTGSESIKYSEN